MKRFILFSVICASAAAQVTFERLLRAAQEPHNWLTYSGSYASHRHSALNQLDRANVGILGVKWVYQMRAFDKVETTPLVVDGIMYLTRPPNDVVALDAATGRPFWTYSRPVPASMPLCCGRVNRGVAILGDRLYMGTLDAKLVSLDARTGRVLWEKEVTGHRAGYSVTVSPLIVKDKVIVGIAGGEYGIRGFLDAYDAATGERVWRFYTIPGPGEKGNETWAGDSWKTGGAGTWLTGSYDPALNLIYWGTGNPSPDWNGDVRMGDNLYSCSVIALDADTGKLRWHFQFIPHDVHDYDAVQIPVLVDAPFRGRPRKLMYWAHRNAFFYVLDRETGEFLAAWPFASQTWAQGIDDKGRPIRKPDTEPTREGTLVYPGVQGGTNWYSPSFHPGTGLFYMTVWEYASIYRKDDAEYSPGRPFFGGGAPSVPRAPGYGALRALNPSTGKIAWEHKMHNKSQAGVLSTAGGLVFGGDDGHFFALDAESGTELWRFNTGGTIAAGPITYLANGRQQVSIAAGGAIFTFGR
jgi:alcohol dehydrogenase (cytochrome c)